MRISILRTTLLLIAALAASVALVACGGDDSTSSDSTSATETTSSTAEGDSSTPEGATEAFLTALANGDGEAACALASEEALKTIEDQEGTCEDAVVSSAGQVTEQDKKDVAEAFLNALYEADGATACRLSTTEAQIDFANGDDCVANVIAVLAPTGADANELTGAEFETVDQGDGEAKVKATLADGSTQTFDLALVDGQWKIDSG